MVKFKIILIVLIIALEAVFAGLNMKNVSDISFGFTVLKDVPVFLSILISFVSGAVIILPFTLLRGKKKKKIENIVPKKKKLTLKKKDGNNIENSGF